MEGETKMINDWREFEKRWELWYDSLAGLMTASLRNTGEVVVLEAGCGDGNLTIPLASHLPDARIIGVDLSMGPYEGCLDRLRERIRAKNLDAQVEVIRGDVRKMAEIEDSSVGLLVSNELLCDLNQVGLRRAMKEFYRVLRTGGVTVHGVLSPVAVGRAQELLILSDAYSIEQTPNNEWFSPTADDVAAAMKQAGFRDIKTTFVDPDLHLTYEVAVLLLRKWGTRNEFFEKLNNELRMFGFKFPLEQISEGRK